MAVTAKDNVVASIDGGHYLQISKEEYDALKARRDQANEEKHQAFLQEQAERRRQDAQARAQKSDEARRQDIAALRASKKIAFMAGIGTEEQFNDQWPAILKQHQLEQMRGFDPIADKRATMDDVLSSGRASPTESTPSASTYRLGGALFHLAQPGNTTAR
jgi:hypothetical protein